MKRFSILSIAAALALSLALATPALSQSVLVDQNPAPVPSAANLLTPNQSEVYTQQQAIGSGTLIQTFIKQPGAGGQILSGGTAFVPGAASAVTRFLSLTDGKSDLGVPMTAAAGTPTGTVGVSRTAGTSLVLTGEATSSSAKTNKVMWEFDLPDTYVAGSNVPVIINANYATTGTVTAASTTITVAMYTETAGVEAILTTTAAQQFTPTAANYTFTVTGTNLVPGQHVVMEVVMLVTTSAGAATGQINSAAYKG